MSTMKKSISLVQFETLESATLNILEQYISKQKQITF